MPSSSEGARQRMENEPLFVKFITSSLLNCLSLTGCWGTREREIDKRCSVSVPVILIHWICRYYGYKPLQKAEKCSRNFDLTNLLPWRHGDKRFTFNWMEGCRLFLRLLIRRNWQCSEDGQVSQARIVYHKLSLNRNANVLFLKYSSFLITSVPFSQFFISGK